MLVGRINGYKAFYNILMILLLANWVSSILIEEMVNMDYIYIDEHYIIVVSENLKSIGYVENKYIFTCFYNGKPWCYIVFSLNILAFLKFSLRFFLEISTISVTSQKVSCGSGWCWKQL